MQYISENNFSQELAGRVTRLDGARPSLRLAVFIAAMASLSAFAALLEQQLADPLGRLLEDRVLKPKQASMSGVDGIIVLGGSMTRVRAALQLAAHYPEAKVVLSGPGSAEVALARRAKNLTGRLTVDRRATNTHENALYSKRLIGTLGAKNWVVVTSAVHMPRALGAFQAVNFPVTPWPVQDTPTTAKARSSWVWHEVFGLIGYRVFGRTRDLFPRFNGTNAGIVRRTPESTNPLAARKVAVLTLYSVY